MIRMWMKQLMGLLTTDRENSDDDGIEAAGAGAEAVEDDFLVCPPLLVKDDEQAGSGRLLAVSAEDDVYFGADVFGLLIPLL